jgi:hypothetical protein
MAQPSIIVKVDVFNISANTAVDFNGPVDSVDEIFVFYGGTVGDGTLAVQGADYSVVLAADFKTARIIPTQSLVVKAAGGRVRVKRLLPYTTDYNMSISARLDERRLTLEFDRTSARFLQLSDRLETSLANSDSITSRAIVVAPGQIPPVFNRAAFISKLVGTDGNGDFIPLEPTLNPTAVLSTQIIDSTLAGRSLLTAASYSVQRTLLGIRGTVRLNTSLDFITTTFDVGTSFVETAGYSVVNDGGAARYRLLGSTPAPVRTYHKQDATGAWWILDENRPTIEMFGAVGNYIPNIDNTPAAATLCDTAFLDAIAYMILRGSCITLLRSGLKYAVSGVNEFIMFGNTDWIGFSTTGINKAEIHRITLPLEKAVFAVRDPAAVLGTGKVIFHNIVGVQSDIGPTTAASTLDQFTYPFNMTNVLNLTDITISRDGFALSSSSPDYLIGRTANEFYLITGGAAIVATAGQTVFSYVNTFTLLAQIVATVDNQKVNVASFTATTVTLAVPVGIGLTVRLGRAALISAGRSVRALKTSGSARNGFIVFEGPSASVVNNGMLVSLCECHGTGFYVGVVALRSRNVKIYDYESSGLSNRPLYIYGRSLDHEIQNIEIRGRPDRGVMAGQKITAYAYDVSAFSGTDFAEHVRFDNIRDFDCGRGLSVGGLTILCSARKVISRRPSFYNYLVQEGSTQPDNMRLSDFDFSDAGAESIYIMSSNTMTRNGRVYQALGGGARYISGTINAAGEQGNELTDVKFTDCSLYSVSMQGQNRAKINVDVGAGPVGVDCIDVNLSVLKTSVIGVSGDALRLNGGSSRNLIEILNYFSGAGIRILAGASFNRVSGYSVSNTTNIIDGGTATVLSVGTS